MRVWDALKRLPASAWVAFGAALALLGLYLRGRRLEAELAQAKLQQVVSQAHAGISKNEGRAAVHLERVKAAERRIEEIETARALATSSGLIEEKRLNALSPDKVHLEYMKILLQKRAEIGMEESLRAGENLGKITIRGKRKPPLPYEE